ncbi:thiamine biosynthetic bifunctional enzyme [Atractiella rhizophila]|nr:thiamine biosynthetic bifunctional enzyme [Atractiella rhizophila]
MQKEKPGLDLSLYLVTQREALPTGVSFERNIEQAILGGVTVVQLREKHADTGPFLDLAMRAKAICDKYSIPLIINDRLDICLSIGASGIHVGQSDLPCSIARKILGPSAYIGVSVNTVEEAQKAVEDGADYVGIGPCFVTKSKSDIKGLLGTAGVAEIVDCLPKEVGCVTIGGISEMNVWRIMHGTVGTNTGRCLDGIAVISAIVSSIEPREASKRLSEEVDAFKTSHKDFCATREVQSIDSILKVAGNLFEKMRQSPKVVQQITNTVVQNDSANLTLALSSSPIMSSSQAEAEDLSKIIGSLVVNLGTLNPEQVDGMRVSGQFANQQKRPVVFDPVGVGASTLRKETTKELLAHWQVSVIKGNAGEIATLSGFSGAQSRGVDSVGAVSNPSQVALHLARKEKCIVAMTGKEDYVSDGTSVYKISNGHKYLAAITGSGCMTGSAIACLAAQANNIHHCEHPDLLAATIAGLLLLEVAGELAAERTETRGPGTFRAALIDETFNLKWDVVLRRAKVERIV